MSVDFGADVSTWPDLDGNFTLMTGRRVVGEAVLRRLMTPRGALVNAPDYGIDLRGWVNASATAQLLAPLPNAIEAECEKDERVFSASATVSFDPQTMTMAVGVLLQTADGPFSLVLAVTAVSLTIISAG